MTQPTDPGHRDDLRSLLEEKLTFLHMEEVKTADPKMRFQIKKDIEEIEIRLKRLQEGSPSEPETSGINVPEPDLRIFVETLQLGHQTEIRFRLHSAGGKGGFFHQNVGSLSLQGSPETYWTSLLQKLEGNDERLSEDRLESLGRSLYSKLFSPELRSAYRRFRNVKSLQIVSDEPWIPWELIKPYDDDESLEKPIEDEFLCERFQLTRWLSGGKPPQAHVHINSLCCIEAGKASGERLPQASNEYKFLTDLAKDAGVDHHGAKGASLRDALRSLRKPAELIHFAGHGLFDRDHPEDARFALEDGHTLRPMDLTGEIQTQIKKTQPLVFMNACKVAQMGWSLTGLGGWVPCWIRDCQCGAFVGPQWSVDDNLALEFARVFYSALQGGKTFGEASAAARERVRAMSPGDSAWLAYTVYAHPNGRLTLGSARPYFHPSASTGPPASAELEREATVDPDRLADLLSGFLPGEESFRRVCEPLSFPVRVDLTPVERWREVVGFCTSRDRLEELWQHVESCLPRPTAAGLRQHLEESFPGREEVTRKTASALPADVLKRRPAGGPDPAKLLGLAFLAELISSVLDPASAELLRQRVAATRLGSGLREDTLAEWLRRCRDHVAPKDEMLLAVDVLVSLGEEDDELGAFALRLFLDHLDRSPLVLDLLCRTLRWWRPGAAHCESWLGEQELAEPPSREAPAALARLSLAERLLREGGAKDRWRCADTDPLSIRWAYRMGFAEQLADLLESCGENRQRVFLRHLRAVSGRERTRLARSLRHLAQRQGGFEELPEAPWGPALQCSLPDASLADLEERLRQDRVVSCWLGTLPQTLSAAQLTFLVKLIDHRKDDLVSRAGHLLLSHTDPRATWRHLSVAGRVEKWERLLAGQGVQDELDRWRRQAQTGDVG